MTSSPGPASPAISDYRSPGVAPTTVTCNLCPERFLSNFFLQSITRLLSKVSMKPPMKLQTPLHETRHPWALEIPEQPEPLHSFSPEAPEQPQRHGWQIALLRQPFLWYRDAHALEPCTAALRHLTRRPEPILTPGWGMFEPLCHQNCVGGNSSTTANADAFAPIIYNGSAGVINDPVLRIQSY